LRKLKKGKIEREKEKDKNQMLNKSLVNIGELSTPALATWNNP
jgi:hypothetical protein